VTARTQFASVFAGRSHPAFQLQLLLSLIYRMLPQAKQNPMRTVALTALDAPTASRKACGPGFASGDALSYRYGTRKYACWLVLPDRAHSPDVSHFPYQNSTSTQQYVLFLLDSFHNRCQVHAMHKYRAVLMLTKAIVHFLCFCRISCNQRESTGRSSVQRNLELAVNISRYWPQSSGISVPPQQQNLPPGPAEITPCDVFRLIRGRTLWIIG